MPLLLGSHLVLELDADVRISLVKLLPVFHDQLQLLLLLLDATTTRGHEVQISAMFLA